MYKYKLHSSLQCHTLNPHNILLLIYHTKLFEYLSRLDTEYHKYTTFSSYTPFKLETKHMVIVGSSAKGSLNCEKLVLLE